MLSRTERLLAVPFSRESYLQAESPRVDSRTDELIWVDLRASTFHVGAEESGILVERLRVRLPRTGCPAPLRHSGDGWVVAGGDSLYWVSEDGAVAVVSNGITPDTTRYLNDGVCAPDGSFWVGSQTAPRRAEGTLYRIAPDLSVVTMLDGVTVSNGIDFASDGRTMIYTDTLPHRRIERFTAGPNGLSDRAVVVSVEGGNPDGLVLDDEGCIWVAVWDAAEVRRYSPDGQLLSVVDTGVQRPTAVALWEHRLVITTARPNPVGAAEAHAHDGRILVVHVAVGGRPARPFGASRRVLEERARAVEDAEVVR